MDRDRIMPSSSAYIDETISERWHARITMSTATGASHAHANTHIYKHIGTGTG